jgi:adenylate cyclase
VLGNVPSNPDGPLLDPLFFESVVSNYLRGFARGWQINSSSGAADFELVAPDSSRTIIEVKARSPRSDQLNSIAYSLQQSSTGANKLLLVTPQPPKPEQRAQFQQLLAPTGIGADWVSLSELPQAIGLESPGDFTSPEVQSNLQTQALVTNFASYERAPIGPGPLPKKGRELRPEIRILGRQFPYHVLARLDKGPPDSLEEELKIGQRVTTATVVLSDLVNFSELVKESSQELLNEHMSKYYQRARDLVFKHNGMLDKFIGDAVLAVFGYPFPRQSAPADALKFAEALVALGRDTIEPWAALLNGIVSTGTRVGVATGELWPMNIGPVIEISLLGDTINRAARLEKQCAVNGILVDNATWNGVRAVDEGYAGSLDLAEHQIRPEDAKGQHRGIRAWRRP